MKETPYGDVLLEIEKGLWEHDARVSDGIAEPYSYSNEHFRACIKVFMSALLWKMWEHNKGVEVEKKADLAEKMGRTLRSVVFKFTGIDTHSLYSQKNI